jgi:hypothetical protein
MLEEPCSGFKKNADVAPGDRSKVKQSPQPASLGLGPHLETHQAHSQQIIRRLRNQEWRQDL